MTAIVATQPVRMLQRVFRRVLVNNGNLAYNRLKQSFYYTRTYMRLCENEMCQQALVQRTNEPNWKFAKRRFCSRRCAAICRPQSVVDKIATSRRAHEQSPEGKLSRLRTNNGIRQWRNLHPDQVHAAQNKRQKTILANNSNRTIAEKRKAYFRTPDGMATKERYRQQYTGVKRPHIRESVKAGLRQFWDSPDGWELRRTLSERRTNGLEDTPYGPGWPQAAHRARERDRCCQSCGVTQAMHRRALPVHHIYPKRMFRYIPGKNENYRWANHLANLVTLCDVCHRKIEMQVLKVPPSFQAQADWLWNEFISLDSMPK